MIYQHGVGTSKYGFNIALPVDKYNTIMKYASKVFSTNYMNDKTFNIIFDRLTAVKTPFKSYMIDATKFEEFTPIQPIEETEEELSESDPEEEQLKTPTQPSTSVKPENISSKGSEFAKKLTNVGNTVGLTYKGKEYVNSEHAYQTWKSGEFNQAGYALKGGKVRGGKIGDTFSIMTDILTEKLKQHPELIQGINERGGLAYIEQSTHSVIGDKFWESTGENKFIEALAKAYQNISTTQPSTQPAEETETNLPPAGAQLDMFDNFDASSEELRKQQEEDERREDEEDNNCTDSPFLD
jgi:hypothetical protein